LLANALNLNNKNSHLCAVATNCKWWLPGTVTAVQQWLHFTARKARLQGFFKRWKIKKYIKINDLYVRKQTWHQACQYSYGLTSMYAKF
jgi:hypothetical protein